MSERTGRVAVVGSAVVDLIAHVHTRPRPGETVLAHALTVAVGGKGCNQAIAAARMGATTSFTGMVGDDPFGEMIRQSLERDGVDARHLRVSTEEGTALGMPVVAGPEEATAMGNLMVQAMGLGIISSMQEALPLIKQAFPIKEYRPRKPKAWDKSYGIFREVCAAAGP